jgi:hypothetical protein
VILIDPHITGYLPGTAEGDNDDIVVAITSDANPAFTDYNVVSVAAFRTSLDDLFEVQIS